jgi:Major capsid protein Gp23
MNLFENLEGYNRADEIKPLINKWGKTGLLEGLGTQYKAAVATMLENQAKQLLKEGSATTAGTSGTGFEQWTGVALPLVRRVFAQIAAKEFVSVQPMNLPSGLVFYLDYKYGTNKQPFGFAPTSQSQVGTLQGVTNTVNADASDGLYGAGRFGYSLNTVTSSLVVATSASATTASVNYDGAYTASISGYQVVSIPVPTSADLNAVRAFTLYTGSVLLTGSQYLPQFTTINSLYTASFVVAVGTFTGNASTAAGRVGYVVNPTNDNRGDFEAKPVSANNRNVDTDLNIPEIELQMRSISLTAKTRKLKASWTPEFAQDLNAYHSVDAEAELTSMLSEYVSMEIDLEILDMLISSAATTDYWSAKIGSTWNGSTGFTTDTTFQGTGYIQGTWYQTLGTKLQKVSNQIHAKTLRGGANFLVCSPNVATILESIPGYAADGDGTKMTYNMGVQKVGALTGRYTVYKNPYMQENTILMGFRGNQFLETGAVYAPYIPLMLTPLVYDPANFTPRRGVMTRYAKVVTRPEFYGKVYVADLNMV